MPIYGKEKHFQMARSILPSKARKRAKNDKDALHRQNRRRASAHYVCYKGYASDVTDIWEDDRFDHSYWVEPHCNSYDSIVWERRANDKLAHFENWAYQITKYLPPGDRLTKIRALLPEGVIGLHALSHLRFLEPPREQLYYRYRGRSYEEEMIPYRLHRDTLPPAPLTARQIAWNNFCEAVRALKPYPKKIREFNKYLVEHRHIEIVSTYVDAYDEATGKTIRKLQTTKIVHPVDIIHGYHDIEAWLSRRNINIASAYRYFGINNPQ